MAMINTQFDLKQQVMIRMPDATRRLGTVEGIWVRRDGLVHYWTSYVNEEGTLIQEYFHDDQLEPA